MLEVVPHGWFSWDFTVRAGSRLVADVDISNWRERGQLNVDGRMFRVFRTSTFGGDFVLESSDGVVARASKPSALRRLFLVTSGSKTYTLKAQAMFRRRFVLLEGDRPAGEIAPTAIFSHRAAATLPEELPLPVRVFLIWLTVILWKREADAASG